MDGVTAADVYDIATPGSPRLSPDGSRIAFVRTMPADEETTEATIYIVGTDDEAEPQRFTIREGEDADPRWSPSGDRIAFTSTRGADDDRQQLWVMPIDGGEARQVTDVVGGVSSIAWSPDGARIAFIQSVSGEDREEERDLAVPDDYEPADPDPRVIERTVYRSMQRYFDDRRSHLYVVDLAATADGPDPDAIERLTDGEIEIASPGWVDDETLVYADHWVGDDPDDSLEYDVIRHNLETDVAERIHRSTGWPSGLAIATDGRIALPYVDPDRASLNQIELDVYDPATGTTRRVTDTLDRTLGFGVAPVWGPDEERLYVTTPDEGAVSVWSVEGDDPDSLEREVREGEIDGMDVGRDASGSLVLALTLSQWDHPGDVFIHEGGDLKRLTRINEAYLSNVNVIEPEPLSVASEEGSVEGWVLTPPEATKENPHPLVVQVHGGPHIMWTTSGTMWHEFQTLAARGYVVFWCNPRGSSGFGREYMRAIDRNWGAVTLEDIEAGVDEVTARPAVDADAVFLTGGSFGGFLTGWAVGQTDRFLAAVAQRGVYDLTMLYGTTDGAYRLVEGDFDTTPWADPSFLWEQSPAAYAHRVTTPTLLIHSDDDFRTPPASAELFYRILRKHEVDTRMVRYPREGHELSRSGEPAHMVDRIERIARWFDGYSPHHDVSPALERPDEADLTASEDEEKNGED